MHILFLSAPGGGLETNVRVLAPVLRKAGHLVSIVYLNPTSRGISSLPDSNGIKVYEANYGNAHYYFHRATFGLTSLPPVIRAYEAAQALKKKICEIHKNQPLDLVEIPEVPLPVQSFPVPYVVRLHSSAWMCRRMFNERSPASDSIEAKLEGLTLRRAGAVTSPSQFVADYISRTCRVSNIRIIPYPVETIEFKPARKDNTQKLILFVGRVERRKGADSLMRAIPSVLLKNPDCKFLFVGQVSEELKNQVNASPAAASFPGVKPRNELVKLYQQATIVVLPSLFDNSPNVIYEAMACGTPVIATRVGGIPELVEDGETGRLVPVRDERALADAIISLLDDAPAQQLMGKRGREKAVAEYALDKIAAMTLGLYTDILEPCSKRSI